MSPDVKLAAVVGVAAFLVAAFIGASIPSEDGGYLGWFRVALGVGVALFLVTLGLLVIPGRA